MAEKGVDRNQIISELQRSAHGKLESYRPILDQAARSDPEFLAHLIAWDFTHGQIKDTKLAIPVISLASREFPGELVENSLAHLAMQPPRELLKALQFAIQSKLPHSRQAALEKMIRRYLRNKEAVPRKWQTLAARHRQALKRIYAITKCGMPEWARVIFRGPYVPGSVFSDIALLNQMDEKTAAATIEKWHLSPLVISGAMTGSKGAKDSSAVTASTMNQMTDTEVITRAKSLERKGAGKDAALKEGFRKKVAKATASKKATLKTTTAADEVEDEGLKTMLRELQERQIQAQKQAGRGINGSWLVIVDKSQSQEHSIELGRHVAAAIAKFVTGRVWLVFCDSAPSGREVTGTPLEAIREQTRFEKAGGSTSYGVGLEWAAQRGYEFDGIAIVGDGGENSIPLFAPTYREHQKRTGKSPTVYLFQTFCEVQYASSPGGNPRNFERLMSGEEASVYGGRFAVAQRVSSGTAIPFTKFDLTHGQVDYYSLPNLISTMGVNRWGILDEIMATPLVTLEQVLPTVVAVGG